MLSPVVSEERLVQRLPAVPPRARAEESRGFSRAQDSAAARSVQLLQPLLGKRGLLVLAATAGRLGSLVAMGPVPRAHLSRHQREVSARRPADLQCLLASRLAQHWSTHLRQL